MTRYMTLTDGSRVSLRPMTVTQTRRAMAAAKAAEARRLTEALDELVALSPPGTAWSPSTYRRLLHYVTEATRHTVRRVTGLTVREGDHWTAEDIGVAIAALLEAQAD